MLIDDITVRVAAGSGGNGAVAFNKNRMQLGPTGASGGKGGDIYIQGISDLGALRQFKFKKEFKADDGQDGGGQFRDGKDGNDLVLKIPVGTVVHNLTTQEDSEVQNIDEKVRIAEGGRGGRGNFHFRSSKNTTPKEFEEGLGGEEFEIRLELKLIADVGFIGLPNVGKSSVLNELTNAKSKTANYPFTTLEPHLGTYYDLILADIPGLIEGASLGKGLGDKFLRHIERTKILFHFISAESQNPLEDYKIIRKELEDYNRELLDKPEYLFLSKSDLISSEEYKKKMDELKSLTKKIVPISIHDLKSIEAVETILRQLIKEKH